MLTGYDKLRRQNGAGLFCLLFKRFPQIDLHPEATPGLAIGPCSKTSPAAFRKSRTKSPGSITRPASLSP